MLSELLSLLYNLPILKRAVRENRVTGLSGCLFSIYTKAIYEKYGKICVVTDIPYRIHTLLSPLLDNIVSVSAANPHQEETVAFLSSTLNPNFTGVCSYIKGIEPPDSFFGRGLSLSKDSQITFFSVQKNLTDSGYERMEIVSEVGQFALRGGIVDVFPLGMKDPIRIEWFGDDVISIREFDVYTQRSKKEINGIFIPPMSVHSGNSDILKYLRDVPIITEIEGIKKDGVIYISNEGINVGGTPSYVGSLSFFNKKLKELSGYRIFISSSPSVKKEIEEFFPRIAVIPLDLIEGFILKNERIALFTFDDIFGRRRHRMKTPLRRPGTPIEDLDEILRGDYVVHADFGVGIYEAIKKINIDGVETDCLFIKYRAEDKLYVPISHIRFVEKYIGDGPPKELDRLGGNEWQRKKEKAKKDIEKMQKELLLLYAERNLKKGYVFSPDTVWQREMETSFPYEETYDQIKVIEEVKKDMESDIPMERLICGDVGFGKTEVAVRASMKVVMDGKQVAVLVPTTILAEQHLETFNKRLGKFPITIEQLSSFVVSKKEKIKRETGEGKIDIIIGTHALLRSRIKWNDLGLLIIDEEHRFGVRDKEKLKMLKKGIDVLLLSATPIPRTLFQSMQGIKDMSQLFTPPFGRMPIVTRVIDWNEQDITDAIKREIEREGQVYFVHNEIKTIMDIKERLENMVPDIKIDVVHGRLPKKELGKRMVKFLHQKTDLLLTTAIIASGIDISNVNTIIINRAWKFGLADLHQLRGRVGRGDRQAYCYLIREENIPDVSQKRIRIFAGFSELGAGMRLAMKDIEIRGAGNLLGAEQHGHARVIGYGMYIKLLEETTKRLKGQKTEKIEDPVIDLAVPSFFPEFYVGREHKLGLYKRLGGINTKDSLKDFVEELKDRFGTLPKEAKNLIKMVEIKLLAEKLGISRIKKNGRILIEWDNRVKNKLSMEKWTEKYDFDIDIGKDRTTINLSSDIYGLKNFLEKIGNKK